MSQPDSISELKSIIRKDALLRRDALPAAERAKAAEAIAARAFPLAIEPGQIVSGFSPLKTEINPIPLMRKLADAGAQLALPVVAGKGKPLIMRAWRFGEPLASGVWGIREPKADAPEVAPDILLVPLLAFDRQRPSHRLWRRLLRHDDREAARHEAGGRGRHRLRGPGNRVGPGYAARRAPRSRANGA